MRLEDESSDPEYFDLDEHLYYTEHNTTYGALCNEMTGRIQLEQTSVWDQLKLDDIDSDLVRECSHQLRTICKEDLLEFKRSINYYRKSGFGKARDQDSMHWYLAKVFTFVEDFSMSSSKTVHKPIRRFRSKPEVRYDEDTGEEVITYEEDINPYTTGFPRALPTFDLMNIDHEEASGGDSRSWNCRDGFCIARIKTLWGPSTPENPDTNSEILSQSANFARLHLSSRPFLLFSIGLLIYGKRFSVCIFDRAGVRISPEHDMFLDMEVFIRVIRSLTCVLGAQDIGQDPTARFVKSPREPDFYVIKPIGRDERSWRTIGPPIWSSMSLFGRGTVVWKVAEYEEATDEVVGPTMIMKTAWRSAQRNPESSLSRYVTAIARQYSEVSVAEFVTGGDVYVEGGSPPDIPLATELSSGRETARNNSSTKTLITIPLLRRQNPSDEDSPILHRVILSTVGRPLWDYKDEKELARGFVAVMRTHKRLCELNVLHRDISPGNILLAEDPENAPPGHEAFLTDFELARVGDEAGATLHDRTQIERTKRPPEMLSDHNLLGSTAKLATPISGTVVFMALDLLKIVVSEVDDPEAQATSFKHNAHHDLESLVFVLAYVLLRKALLIASSDEKYKVVRKNLDEEFRKSFGRIDSWDILTWRRSLMCFRWIGESYLAPFIREHFSKVLLEILGIIYRKMFRIYFQEDCGVLSKATVVSDPAAEERRMEEDDLTHDYLLKLFLYLADYKVELSQ
ncbi:hypothetical protein SCHPADRAFT_292602 [Schizopora paradoxa]|uniref:Protein kinase domain-containing protein n=1 Tax=Schizopora paradoxa TaxID=27342 RepID=A0A0H2RT45_9AGAM|nr:hypothetical protein SCHPADRAFT_292602 [Schizopora paradoxa]